MTFCFSCQAIAAGAALVIALVFARVSRLGAQPHLRLWSVGWGAVAAGALVAASFFLPQSVRDVVTATAKIVFAATFVAGAVAYAARAARPRMLTASPLIALTVSALLGAYLGGAFASLIAAITATVVAAAGAALFVVSRRRSTLALAFGTMGLAAAEIASAIQVLDPLAASVASSLLAVVMLGFACESQREEAVARLSEAERLAWHDPLTGLPNRRLFIDRAAMALARAKRTGTHVGVVFVDLDRFKLVNDTMGHDVGDEVLRGFGKRLSEHLREGDTIARVGGDEFTLLMPDVRDVNDFPGIATKLLAKLRAPLEVGGRSVGATASIGIAMYPDHGTDTHGLLRSADAAMYRAKQRGGDNFQLCVPSLDASDGVEQGELERRLRRAVAHEEFVLYYQPRVDPRTGSVVACEALIRWNDPQQGLILPAHFIHTAETSGIIVPMGEWVLRTACRQAAQWHSGGLQDLVVAVNLSPRQFKQHDLIDTIEQALTEAGLDARYLELEVDESGIMHDAEGSMRILQRLRTLGVRVLISAFGAGYSSISYLQRFPIDGVKLDRSFLVGDGHNGDRSLAVAALGMARALRLKVIGEGVETAEAADFLRAHACAGMQGFLVSAPVPADECTRFIFPAIAPRRRDARVPAYPHPSDSLELSS